METERERVGRLTAAEAGGSKSVQVGAHAAR